MRITQKTGLFGLDKRTVFEFSATEQAALLRARDIADKARTMIVERYPEFQDSDDDTRLGMVGVAIEDAMGDFRDEIILDEER